MSRYVILVCLLANLVRAAEAPKSGASQHPNAVFRIRNGETISGRLVQYVGGYFTVDRAGAGRVEISVRDIEAVVFGGKGRMGRRGGRREAKLFPKPQGTAPNVPAELKKVRESIRGLGSTSVSAQNITGFMDHARKVFDSSSDPELVIKLAQELVAAKRKPSSEHHSLMLAIATFHHYAGDRKDAEAALAGAERSYPDEKQVHAALGARLR